MVIEALVRGVAFFDILQDHNRTAMGLYDPPREIVGKFSGNPPMPWTVHSDPLRKTLSISGSSPVPVTTPEYLRQVEITRKLGGKVLAAFPTQGNSAHEKTIVGIETAGYEPHVVQLDPSGHAELADQIALHNMEDARQAIGEGLLVATPFGFTSLTSSSNLNVLLPTRMTGIHFGPPKS